MRVAKIWLAMVVIAGAMGFAPILGATGSGCTADAAEGGDDGGYPEWNEGEGRR